MNKVSNLSDKLAIGLSVMCVVHCILMPIVLIALPSVSALASFDHHVFHQWLVFAVIPISLFAVITGYLHHRNIRVLAMSFVGLAMLIFAAAAGHDALGEIGEIALTLAGSILIALSHFKNLALRRASAA